MTHKDIIESGGKKVGLTALEQELVEALQYLLKEAENGNFDGMDYKYWCGEKGLKLAHAAISKAKEYKQ